MKLLTAIILLAMVACTHKVNPPKQNYSWKVAPGGTRIDSIWYSVSPIHLAPLHDKPDSSWLDTVHGFIRYPKYGKQTAVLISVNKNRQELHYITDPSTPTDVYERAIAIYYVTHLMNALTIGLDGQATDTLKTLKKILLFGDARGEGMYSDGTPSYGGPWREFDLSKHHEFITADKIVRE